MKVKGPTMSMYNKANTNNMNTFFSRTKDDSLHLYKLNNSTRKFYYMDHCWTGKGIWYEREYPPVFEIVEISEERALEIAKGNLSGISK